MPTHICIASHRQRGMTMVELVMGLVIVAIIAAAGATFIGRLFDAYFDTRDVTRADWQGRVAFERMTRELREIPSRTGLVSSPLSTEITFVNTQGSTVRYFLNGTTLTRRLSGVDQPLAENVTSLNFVYLLQDGVTATTASASLCYVTAKIVVRDDAFNDTLRATVAPRNFQPCP